MTCAGILGMSNLLATTALTSEQQEYAAAIELSSNHLLGVISDILDFSRLESGKLELSLSEVSIRAVVEDSIDMVFSAPIHSQIEVIHSIQVHPALPENMLADEQRVRQVLVNLLSNALKFTSRVSATRCYAGLRKSGPCVGSHLFVFCVSCDQPGEVELDVLYVASESELQRRGLKAHLHSPTAESGVSSEIARKDAKHAGSIELVEPGSPLELGILPATARSFGPAPHQLDGFDMSPPLFASSVKLDSSSWRPLVTSVNGSNAQRSSRSHLTSLLATPSSLKNSTPSTVVGPFALFQVRDTGKGIPKDQQRRLFSAFSQLDNSNTRQHQGTGLGLVISLKLAQQMGGAVWVVSESDAGSVFCFALPLRGPSNAVLSNVAASSDAGRVGVVSLQPEASVSGVADLSRSLPFIQPYGILIVVPNRAQLGALFYLLRHHFEQVEVASDSAEALRIAATRMAPALQPRSTPALRSFQGRVAVRQASVAQSASGGVLLPLHCVVLDVQAGDGGDGMSGEAGLLNSVGYEGGLQLALRLRRQEHDLWQEAVQTYGDELTPQHRVPILLMRPKRVIIASSHASNVEASSLPRPSGFSASHAPMLVPQPRPAEFRRAFNPLSVQDRSEESRSTIAEPTFHDEMDGDSFFPALGHHPSSTHPMDAPSSSSYPDQEAEEAQAQRRVLLHPLPLSPPPIQPLDGRSQSDPARSSSSVHATATLHRMQDSVVRFGPSSASATFSAQVALHSDLLAPQAYVTKPVRHSKLLETISMLIRAPPILVSTRVLSMHEPTPASMQIPFSSPPFSSTSLQPPSASSVSSSVCAAPGATPMGWPSSSATYAPSLSSSQSSSAGSTAFEVAAVAAPAVTTSANTSPVPVSSSTSMHILIVEDQPINQKLVAKMLQKLNFTYEIAENGLIAFESVKRSYESGQRRFDVILMVSRQPTCGCHVDGAHYTLMMYLLWLLWLSS
jgi:signal transduction histidine kinase